MFEDQHERLWFERVAGDPEIQTAGRFTDVGFTLVCDTEARTYQFRSGVLTGWQGAGNSQPEERPVLTGSADAWANFLAPIPPPFANHVLAMDRRRDDFEISAGREQLIRHLRVIDLVLQQMRTAATEESAR